MTLSAARGPISDAPLGRFLPPVPAGTTFIEPHPRRVQAVIDGETVIDTENVLLIHRSGHALAYLFAVDDIAGLPTEVEPDTPGFVRVPWDAVDAWYEEGRLLVHYPPNPYHRVDCRPTSRRLRVEIGREVLVDTTDTLILFETSLDAKLYVARHHVRMDLLTPSETTTYCNYKGWTTYWNATVDGEVVEDVAWSYDDPLPETMPIAGLISFEPERVDLIADLPHGPTVSPAPTGHGIVCDC